MTNVVLNVLFLLLIIVASSTSSLIANDLQSVRRTVLKRGVSVLSLHPQGWLMRATRKQDAAVAIKEVVYVPSPLSLSSKEEEEEEEEEGFTDDEHLCSRLCDRGYVVHVLMPPMDDRLDYFDALMQVLQWRRSEQKVPLRTVCVVAQELACPHVLNWLAKALQMQTQQMRMDVGACVLIQPPPLEMLTSEQGRVHILERRYGHLDFCSRVLAAEEKKDAVNDDDKTRVGGVMLEEEIALIEWQSSQAYKDPLAVLMRKQRERREFVDKIKYNTGGAGDDNDERRRKLGLLPSVLQLVGARPVLAVAVGEALQNRILVISTEKEYEREEVDDWSHASCQELAALYKAGAVINTLQARDLEREEEQDETALADEDVLNTIICDWLNLLTHCNFL